MLNILFPLNWILWTPVANVWNLSAYLILGVIVFFVSVIVFVIILPLSLIFISLVLALSLFFVLLDGPVLLAIILFFVVVVFGGFGLFITSPIWLLIIGIFIPFDKVFYLWVGILIFVVFWEVVLPFFGAGL